MNRKKTFLICAGCLIAISVLADVNWGAFFGSQQSYNNFLAFFKTVTSQTVNANNIFCTNSAFIYGGIAYQGNLEGPAVFAVSNSHGGFGYIGLGNTVSGGSTATRTPWAFGISNTLSGPDSTALGLGGADNGYSNCVVLGGGSATAPNETISGNPYYGPGTGLTGTASGLSIGGNAATATSAANVVAGISITNPIVVNGLFVTNGAVTNITGGVTNITSPAGTTNWSANQTNIWSYFNGFPCQTNYTTNGVECHFTFIATVTNNTSIVVWTNNSYMTAGQTAIVVREDSSQGGPNIWCPTNILNCNATSIGGALYAVFGQTTAGNTPTASGSSATISGATTGAGSLAWHEGVNAVGLLYTANSTNTANVAIGLSVFLH